MKRTFVATCLTAALLLSAGFAVAADDAPAKEKARVSKQVYGSQLMTRKERMEYRAKMRAAKTAEERAQIRKEHHEKMKERAKERGVTLPDEPSAMGQGMGQGSGMGGGGRNR